jgi:PAS domain S-box-containing protein
MSEQVDIFPPAVDEDPIRRSLDCLREGFQIIGFDWKYIYVNPAAARHGRRSAGELIGQKMTQAYPGIDRTPMFETLRQAMDERTSHVLENEFTFPDGSTRWFEIRVQPVPEGICVYSSDIEHRKRREQAAGGTAAFARVPLLSRISRLLRGSHKMPNAQCSMLKVSSHAQ